MVVNEKSGQLLWQQNKCQKGVKALYFIGGFIVRVLKGSDKEDFIECLNPKDGSVIWLTKIEDKVVSPLVKCKDGLLFTGDKAIYSLIMKTGKSRFFTPLPERFTRNSPTFAPLLGTPDMISLAGEKMWVWRDRAGVLAVALPLGKIICQHYPLLPIPDYNVNDATNLLFQVRNIVPQNLKSGGVIPLQEPGPNPFLLAAERRHAEVMSNKRSDSLDVNISSSHVISQTKISSAFNQAQAAVNMGVSMIAAAQAIRQLNKMRAQEGLKQRYAMQARAIMRRKQQAFQGEYFIEPFLARGVGMGLTLISLKSGKRRDFLYSPLVVPLLDFSVDLLTYRLDSHRERLYLVGVGMDEKKYVPMKKWRWRLPRLSLIAYDLSTIPWSTENRVSGQTPGGGQGKVLSQEEIQKIVEAALKAQGIKPPKAGVGGAGGATGGGAGGATIAAVLREKRYDEAFALIKKGADVNKPGAFNLAPVHFAAMQLHLKLLRELIAKGANVNAKNGQGHTPLLMLINNGYWFVHKEKTLPIIEELLKSGADTSLKTNLNISLTEHAKKQSRQLGRLFERYSRR